MKVKILIFKYFIPVCARFIVRLNTNAYEGVWSCLLPAPGWRYRIVRYLSRIGRLQNVGATTRAAPTFCEFENCIPFLATLRKFRSRRLSAPFTTYQWSTQYSRPIRCVRAPGAIYSFLNPFTGFAAADLMVRKLIVANAINIAPAPANINTHKLRLVW